MSDIHIRQIGRAGRITLNRPDALNALTPEMCTQIDAALALWSTDPGVSLLIIDAIGERAFSAGGDITMIYEAGQTGNLDIPRAFWRDEYRMNARLFSYPKPVVTFLQGFTMGGGVGVGCHGTHRIVCDSSRIAMPECGIGLVPDVGGSLILARAPGQTGEFLGMTEHRMGPACAIFAGFADTFVPASAWPDVITALETDADLAAIASAATDPGPSALAQMQHDIDTHFAAPTAKDIATSLEQAQSDFAHQTLAALAKVSPLSAACTAQMITMVRKKNTISAALEMEYRFTYRAIPDADLIEGIRAAIIDKDRTPKWRHADIHAVPPDQIAHMLAPLGPDTWTARP